MHIPTLLTPCLLLLRVASAQSAGQTTSTTTITSTAYITSTITLSTTVQNSTTTSPPISTVNKVAGAAGVGGTAAPTGSIAKGSATGAPSNTLQVQTNSDAMPLAGMFVQGSAVAMAGVVGFAIAALL